MKRNLYWYPVDNAGKIFPAVSKDSRSSVFRLSFYLSEVIDPVLLEQAVNDILPRFEPFAVELKSGLFWYYLSVNKKRAHVKKEDPSVTKFIPWAKNSGYLFQVFYYENKITLETFHSLSDGTGALEFLKSITYRYLTLLGHTLEHEGKILGCVPSQGSESLDMFTNSYDRSKKKNMKEEPAYHLSGEKFKDHFTLCVRAEVKTDELLALARKYNVTIGEYMTALLAYSIYSEDASSRSSKKPIKIFVPVNLRRFFPSNTIRNFSLYIKATYYGRESFTFDRMLSVTKEQFDAQLKKEDLHERINSNVGIEKNPFIRILPLSVKNLAFRLGYYYFAENINTCAISNLGPIKLPSSMQPLIKDAEFSIGGNCLGIVSINGHTNIMMNSEFKNLKIIQYFIRTLVSAGLSVTIDTNYKEGLDEIL